jgi:hypothetical protein
MLPRSSPVLSLRPGDIRETAEVALALSMLSAEEAAAVVAWVNIAGARIAYGLSLIHKVSTPNEDCPRQ